MSQSTPSHNQPQFLQSANEAAVQAAFLCLAAVGSIDITDADTFEKPTVTVWKILDTFFDSIKASYHGNRKVESATLSMNLNDNRDGIALDSELFEDAYILIPNYRPMTNGRETRALFFDNSISRCYSCWTQIFASSSQDRGLADVPTLDEFVALVFLLAAHNVDETATGLRWLESADVHFGVTPELTQPGYAELRKIAMCRDAVASSLDTLQLSGRPAQLRQMLIEQLRITVAVCTVSGYLFGRLDEQQVTAEQEKILATGCNASLLPSVRAMSMEYLSYVNNRLAKASDSAGRALQHYVEAARMAHAAVLISAMPRSAKYVAQNLLEAALLTHDHTMRRASEIIWIDSYIMPYVRGILAHGNRLFNDVGWTSGDPTSPRAISLYATIPRYRDDPDFVISGSMAQLNESLSPGFTVDLWSAAVLLVQHFKDLDHNLGSTVIDSSVPVFVNSDAAEDRWPLRASHPVAWLFLLADGLLARHQSGRHRHAGLMGAFPLQLSYRKWMSDLIASSVTGDIGAENRHPVFPQVAKFLAPDLPSSQSQARIYRADWSTISSAWMLGAEPF